MKFLHTADWHLGAKTGGKDRLPEQRLVLDEIVSIVNYENIDCVIIAGDVFNSSNPSADAEELFFDTIGRISNDGERFVFVLAGNHDDPTRLSAGLPLAGKHNIALVSDLTKLNKNLFTKNTEIQVIETGSGFLRIKKDDEVATIAYLPYPSESRIDKKVDSDLSYAEKVKFWADIGSSAFDDGSLNIFVSHLFLANAKLGESEIRVGNLLAVDKNVLPKADYTALGHIHGKQSFGDNIFYSGAITALSVNEKNLSVQVFESENGKIASIKPIVLTNVAKYETVKATSLEDADKKLDDYDDIDLVELEITQKEPLSASGVKDLRKNHACLSCISLNLVQDKQTEQQTTKSRKVLTDKELFIEFYKKQKGIEPSDELTQMFLSCKGGLDETN